MNYNKTSGNRELCQVHKVALEHERDNQSDLSSLSVTKANLGDYKKTEGKREPQLYVLFVEGDSKEPEYFKFMQGRHSFSGLKITYMLLANCSEYKGNLAQKMCEVVKESYKNECV